MKALSIRQPWAWLICAGYKDIENRDWATAQRGRIYIHAGERPDYDSLPEVERIICGNNVPPDVVIVNGRLIIPPNRYLTEIIGPVLRKENSFAVFGAIIGEVDIVDCLMRSESPWFVGPYGFILANPKLYDKPIPCRGAHGFFEPQVTGAAPERG